MTAILIYKYLSFLNIVENYIKSLKSPQPISILFKNLVIFTHTIVFFLENKTIEKRESIVP